MDQRTQALCAFLNKAHSFYHTAANLAAWLDEAGYTRLNESADWSLVPGGKYYVCRGGSSILAFRVPVGTPAGYMMSASHLDHPTFKIKANGELTGTYTRVATEKYGGSLAYTWLDRPLSIAGRVMVETEDGIRTQLIDIDRDLALIPSVAIHMNRNANEGLAFNFAVDTLPLIGTGSSAGKLEQILEEAAGGKILGHDLYLYVRQNASVWGVNEEFISAPALDNLLCIWGCTQGFLKAEQSGSIPVLTVFDSEEVGSNSPQGADSTMLSGILARISRCLNLNHDRMLANSMMVSADMAHAIHPNHPELSDATNAPVMNGGVVLKFNASTNYTTCGLTDALFRKVCGKADVPCQTYYNRADIRGGATLGHISVNHVSVPTADVGLAQLAMHSSVETAGVEDPFHLENAMAAYYSATLETDGENYILR